MKRGRRAVAALFRGRQFALLILRSARSHRQETHTQEAREQGLSGRPPTRRLALKGVLQRMAHYLTSCHNGIVPAPRLTPSSLNGKD